MEHRFCALLLAGCMIFTQSGIPVLGDEWSSGDAILTDDEIQNIPVSASQEDTPSDPSEWNEADDE